MLKKVAIIALLGASSVTFAGGWQVKVGASALAPSGESDLLNGALKDVSASNEIGFTPAVEYFFADTPFSAELLLATPFKHEVEVQGTKIATFKHLPPTITAKYNFKNATRFTPYIGVGATAVIPFDEKIDGAKLKVDNAFGVAGQVGFNFQPADAENWGVYADVRYADIATDVALNGTDLGELDVNPWVYTIGYSYKF